MSAELKARAREEIEALHEFFVGWFSGALPPSAFEEGFEARFDPSFVLIPPAGTTLSLADLSNAVREAHGSNTGFRIAIRKVRLRRMLDGHILATYEEWQRNALESTPPDNGRAATVLFELGPRLRWIHVHETWLPDEVAAAGPYDF